MIQPTAFNVTTLLMAAITIWILNVRWRGRSDTNWPLFYYLALFAYLRKFEDVLEPGYVYVAVVAGLLVRFEYLSGRLLKAIQIIESACLAYVILRCLQVVFGFH